jgi:hypothetical protein
MTAAPPSGRARWWLAGSSLVLITAVGLVAWLVLRPGEYVASPPRVQPVSADPGAAAQA